MRFEFLGPNDPGFEGAIKWCIARLKGCERGWRKCVVMRVFDAETKGVVVFHDWNPEAGTMCMSAAGDHWLNKSVLYAMHAYIFNTAQCQLAVLQVSENNGRMLRIAQAYGYRGYRVPRLRGRTEAEVILTLSDDDWRASRFHESIENGKIRRASAP